MKYKITMLLIIIASGILLLCQYNKITKSKYVIAIIQSAAHPALDSARDAFIETLNAEFQNEKIEFLLYNTQGSLSTAHALASQLIQNKQINLFYTIGSSVTQALSQLEKTKPIFFAAVSDPDAIGIKNGQNITGISDMLSPEIPFYLINTIYPKAQKIGLLFSLSALNQTECIKIRQALEKNGKTVIDIIINNEGEIDALLESNINNIDAILSPCDNIIATAMPLIVKKTIIHQKPFFVCFNEATIAGALASCGTNYYESGKKIAMYATQVIKKEIIISDINITMSHNNTIYVNKKTAHTINIDMSLIKNNNIIII